MTTALPLTVGASILASSSHSRAAGPCARVTREPGQARNRAAISDRGPVPRVSWPLVNAMSENES